MLKEITDLELYLLSIIKWQYIELENSFVNDDGVAFLKLNIDSLPTPDINVKRRYGTGIITHSVKDLFENHLLCPSFIDRDSYFITVDLSKSFIDIQRTTPLTEKPYLGVRNKANIISYILESMEVIDYSDYSKYQEQINAFLDSICTWVLHKMRNHDIFKQARGKFLKDRLDFNIYVQLRVEEYGHKYLYYIIGNCYNALNKQLSFISVDNDKNDLFVAANT